MYRSCGRYRNGHTRQRAQMRASIGPRDAHYVLGGRIAEVWLFSADQQAEDAYSGAG